MADPLSALVVTATTIHHGVIAVGYFQTEDDRSPFVVVRFLANGTLDPAFGLGGVVTVPVGTCDDLPVGVAVQGDGKILVVGTAFDFDRGSQIAALRLSPEGRLDSSFGVGGVVRWRLSSGYDQAVALEVGEEGSLILVTESGLDHGRGTLVLGPRGEAPDPLFLPGPSGRIANDALPR